MKSQFSNITNFMAVQTSQTDYVKVDFSKYRGGDKVNLNKMKEGESLLNAESFINCFVEIMTCLIKFGNIKVYEMNNFKKYSPERLKLLEDLKFESTKYKSIETLIKELYKQIYPYFIKDENNKDK